MHADQAVSKSLLLWQHSATTKERTGHESKMDDIESSDEVTTTTPMDIDNGTESLGDDIDGQPAECLDPVLAIPSATDTSAELLESGQPNIVPAEPLPYDRTLRASPKRRIGDNIPETPKKRTSVPLTRPSIDFPEVTNSLATDPEWRQALYSPQAGTSTTGASLLEKLDRKGHSSPNAVEELEKYATYEFESFTFLQEIIPNLFLGRYLLFDANVVYSHSTHRHWRKRGSLVCCLSCHRIHIKKRRHRSTPKLRESISK